MPILDPDRRREYHRKWIANRRYSFFHGKVCVKCGSSDRLELDHINPEEKVDHRIWSWSEKRRQEEINKCQVLCYVCHKEKTRLMALKPEPPHGTNERYRWREKETGTVCSCQPCKAAHAAEQRIYRLNKKKLSRTDGMQTCNS